MGYCSIIQKICILTAPNVYSKDRVLWNKISDGGILMNTSPIDTRKMVGIESHEINRYKNKNDNNEWSTYHQVIFKVTHTHYKYGWKRERKKRFKWKTMPFPSFYDSKQGSRNYVAPWQYGLDKKLLKLVEPSFESLKINTSLILLYWNLE